MKGLTPAFGLQRAKAKRRKKGERRREGGRGREACLALHSESEEERGLPPPFPPWAVFGGRCQWGREGRGGKCEDGQKGLFSPPDRAL